MSSSRRDALIGRFRASSQERVRRLASAFGSVKQGTATPEEHQQVARELHTLKGEATMLNFASLGELVHAAEETLAAAKDDDARRKDAAGRILGALSAIAEWLRGELGDGARADEALDAARARLLGAPAAVHGESLAPAAHAPAAAVPDAAPRHAGQRWVQVNARRIDEHSERVLVFEAEFRALHLRLRHHARALQDASARGIRSLLSDFERCEANLEDITSSAWSLRLVPLEAALSELAASARALASANGKALHVTVSGGHAQIERTVLESLEEPLLHLVRNAVDHGIEPPSERTHKGQGRLVISAEAVGANIVLTVADDGRGIDHGKVRAAAVSRGLLDEKSAAALADDAVFDLLFVHGFSTRSTVTNLSGRGVGLDVVRASIQALGGTVTITSEIGKGTQFMLTVPGSITKEKGLVFEVDGSLYAIPSRNVRSLVRLADSTVEAVAGGSVLRVANEAIPLRSIHAALGLGDADSETWAVVVEVGRQTWAFTVAKPLGDFPLLRRPIDRIVSLSAPVSASASFEDGRLVLILAVSDLVRQSRPQTTHRAGARASERPVRVLVVDDSAVVRELLFDILSHAGIEVRLASDGARALRMIPDESPDLVLLDIDMPQMDGFGVLREVRTSSDVPVVMLSLRASPEDQRRAASLGANAYIVKSQFQETTLVDTIHRLLGRSS